MTRKKGLWNVRLFLTADSIEVVVMLAKAPKFMVIIWAHKTTYFMLLLKSKHKFTEHDTLIHDIKIVKQLYLLSQATNSVSIHLVLNLIID